ncbi:MAG: regulatory signaling modulator protein AmpE [Gammaproteobacteria bacterium]|nr:regulatory signaling modulator protein AmpE [Gammaproteobacteria bacterium]
MLIALLCALLLSYYFGELKQYNPLVALKQLANMLETRLNEDLHDETVQDKQQNRINGLIALIVCIVPIWWLSQLIIPEGLIGYLFEGAILYVALSFNHIKNYVQHITHALETNNLVQARYHLSMISHQDVRQMDDNEICRTTTESILEQGNNALLAVFFWFIVTGISGVIIYTITRLLNGLWDQKTPRYHNFSFFIVKFYYLLNFIPARLSALTYALMGNWHNAIQSQLQQGVLWEIPNDVVLITSGMGALDLSMTQNIQIKDIMQAYSLLERSTLFWLAIVAMLSIPYWFCS